MARPGEDRGRGGRGRAPPRARGLLGVFPHRGGRSPLRERAFRAGPGRVDGRSRLPDPAGSILGEDRSGALASLRGLHRPTPGGTAIPPEQSTTGVAGPAAGDGNGAGVEDRRGHTRVGEPAGEPRTPRADAITRELTADQRALLGDLFAVIEEHASDATEAID